MFDLPDLPVKAVLPQLDHALEAHKSAVLVAQPGAGKTTLVPLHLLQSNALMGRKIIVLEPRRLAAKAAAQQMARLLGEQVGESVGYIMRLEKSVGPQTRIIVMTEGVFVQMLIENPELPDIGAVLFDEFHERSLDADFAFALTLDIRSALRDDLLLLVMSATIDSAKVAELLDNAPIIEAQGRSFPVEIRYHPRGHGQSIEQAMAQMIHKMIMHEEGSILAFLPGMAEISRTQSYLQDYNFGDHIRIIPLYGALERSQQDAAIKPAPDGIRKVVLATSIAESSLTIEGLRIVIDSGLARVPRFDHISGFTRLETQKISQASAKQRAGRAGRMANGIAVRLWHEGQMSALQPYNPPEILSADLSSLILNCAAFGVQDPRSLPFPDLPPQAGLTLSRDLLVQLGAMDKDFQVTPLGLEMNTLPFSPRLSKMIVSARERAQDHHALLLSFILTEPGLGGTDVDIERRLQNFKRDTSPRAKTINATIKKMAVTKKTADNHFNSAQLLLSAFSDRLAKARDKQGNYLLANGKGAYIDPTNALAQNPYLIVADLSGQARTPRILAAAAVDEQSLRLIAEQQAHMQKDIYFDPNTKSLRGRQRMQLGALTLSEHPIASPSGLQADQILLAAIRQYGLNSLPWQPQDQQLRTRMEWLHETLGGAWPSMSDDSLLEELELWLQPFIQGRTNLKTLPPKTLYHALLSRLPHDLQRQIDHLAPIQYQLPTGTQAIIDYSRGTPTIAVRVQELYGLSNHPTIAGGQVPLTLELLSPAHRPIQITRDLPAFWQGSWKDVCREMRGRYPKHLWPEDPLNTAPTRHVKSKS